MKERLLPLLLLAALLLACRVTSVPATTQPADLPPVPTPIPPRATSTEPSSPAPTVGLTLQDPMLSDPVAGQAKFRLLELGYDICTVTTDFYNYQVEAALRQFQQQAGIPPSGVLTDETLQHLLAGDAPSRAPVAPSPLLTGDSFYIEMGEVFAVSPESFWILQGSLIARFSRVDGEFLGFYQVEPLPGEWMYAPVAALYAEGYLWIAQQGPEDALLQAYDPASANPTEALLKPVLPASIHFSSVQLYPASAFDGQAVWLLVDDPQTQSVVLQPLNIHSHTAGEPIRIGQSSGFGYGYGIAYDKNTSDLWVSYADEVFGEQAIVKVEVNSAEIGPALGPCGMGVAFSMDRLWFANQQGLWSYDPLTSDRRLYQLESDSPLTLVPGEESLWVLDLYGMLTEVTAP